MIGTTIRLARTFDVDVFTNQFGRNVFNIFGDGTCEQKNRAGVHKFQVTGRPGG